MTPTEIAAELHSYIQYCRTDQVSFLREKLLALAERLNPTTSAPGEKRPITGQIWAVEDGTLLRIIDRPKD